MVITLSLIHISDAITYNQQNKAVIDYDKCKGCGRCIGASVSYTHLAARTAHDQHAGSGQPQQRGAQQLHPGQRLAQPALAARQVDHFPVSYTHLDVYKRQPLHLS